MDVTPKAFRDVQFREKLRGGYHPEDVDEFLEQAALGVEALTERLQQATERAERAEKSASEASATDDSLKRMLLLAQRTVDQAVKEAHDDADKLLAEARSQVKEAHADAEKLLRESHDDADKLLADARAQADTIVSEAQDRGRAAYEDHLAEGRASVEMASSALQQAQQEVDALRGWVDLNRAHLLGALHDAEAAVQNAGLLSEPPTITSVTINAWQDDAGPDVAGHAAGSSAGGSSAGLVPEAGLTPAVAEDDEEPDPRHLENPRAREVLPAPPAGPADQNDEAGQVAAGPGDVVATNAVATTSGADGASAETPPGEDQSMAFDERALDSFFSEQDLGEQRTTGRFRRRQ